MAMTKYQHVLLLVNKIEQKYGSISNCPESDPDYLKIRELYPDSGHGKHVNDFKDQIYRMAHEGYSITDVVNLVNVNYNDVYDFVKRHEIKFKEVFNYRIISPLGDVYYVTNLAHFIKQTFKRVPNQRSQFLKERNFKVTQGRYRWKFIKNGSYYLTTYFDKPVQKNGINSYMYME